MREIKFKIRNKNNGQWAYFKLTDGFSFLDNYDKETICQFTGLLDKNGKEIYEGDILDCGDRIIKVVWHNLAGQWDADWISYKGVTTSNGILNTEWKYRAKIIGDIYENNMLSKLLSETSERFDKEVNKLRNLQPKDAEGKCETVLFGYKEQIGDELFNVIDFGNIKNFLRTAMVNAYRLALKDSMGCVSEVRAVHGLDVGWERGHKEGFNACRTQTLSNISALDNLVNK